MDNRNEWKYESRKQGRKEICYYLIEADYKRMSNFLESC